MDLHCVAGDAEPLPGRCTWIWHFSGACVRCEAEQFPGEPECCDHWIARVQREHPEDRPRWRSFGPTPVTIPEVLT